MVKVIDVINYISTEARKCKNNSIYIGDDVIIASETESVLLVGRPKVIRIDICRRDIRDCIFIEMGKFCDDVNIVLIGHGDLHRIPISPNTEFDIDNIIADECDKLYSQMLINLVSLYHTPIDPQYSKRVWTLHSFGDNYMKQSFTMMNQIKKKLQNKCFYLRFMDKDCKTVPFEECTVVSFDNYPNHNCLIARPIKKITIQDGICEIIIKHKSPNPETHLYLYESQVDTNE